MSYLRIFQPGPSSNRFAFHGTADIVAIEPTSPAPTYEEVQRLARLNPVAPPITAEEHYREMAARPWWARPPQRGLEALGEMGAAIVVGGAAGAFLYRKSKLVGAVLGIAAGLAADTLWARYKARGNYSAPFVDYNRRPGLRSGGIVS